MQRLIASLALLISLGCGGAPPSASSVTAISGAKLIDGTGAEPVADSVILIDGDRIVAAGPRGELQVPDGAQVVDAAGKTVIPGLIDLHSHYSGDAAKQLAAQLAFGVVGARSIGTDTDEVLETIGHAQMGHLPSPVIVTAGTGFTHPQGHPVAIGYLRRPTTPEEAREGVRELARQKVGFTKMWVDSKYGSIPKISREIREAIVDEASKHGIVPVAHIFDLEDFYHLDDLGVTDFLHSVRDTEPMDEKFIETAKAHGSTFAATLTVIESNWLFLEQPQKLIGDSEAAAASTPETLAMLADDAARTERLQDPLLSTLKPELERAKRFVKQIHDADITITLGSDSNGAMIPMGWGTHNELRLLVEAGIAPLEVLKIATSSSARLLGEPGGALGSIAAGKSADLIVLDADPTVDITNTRRIDRVMQRGKWVDRQALLGL